VNLTRSQAIEWPGFKVLIPKEATKASFAVTPCDPECLLLGRLMPFEILRLPAPPKKIGAMTYPLRNISQALALNPELLTDFNKEATIVMLTPQHISRVAFDPETNEIRFLTMAVGTFGMAVPAPALGNNRDVADIHRDIPENGDG
jgi:hypothetical protein